MRRHLLIVSRGQAQLYGYLAQTFGEDDALQVVLDRRFAERRRQRPDAHDPERRRGDSRSRADLETKLQAHGYVFVCLD